jgi:dimeric dUTPase (all-alpha-NTP-PPase superfamily)
VNIDDVSNVDVIEPKAILPSIFTKQSKLYEKYYGIERRNGFYKPDISFNNTVVMGVAYTNSANRPSIDDAQFQHWLKDMLWRATEEVAEAMETFPNDESLKNWRAEWDNNANVRHFFEELADALHFLAEVSVVVGVNQFKLVETWQKVDAGLTPYPAEVEVRERVLDFIVAMGLVGNTLKNKPWKSTHMPTDQDKFMTRLDDAWLKFFELWKTLDCSPTDVYGLYFKKNAVNQFRQRSNY